MRLKTFAVALVLVSLLPATALQAGEPFCRILGCPVPDCIGKWCCDDYRPKCPPCIKVPLCFECDDYCSKRMPKVCVGICFGCDDYCKKCLPPVCKPPLLHALRCFPSKSPCRCSKAESACPPVVTRPTKPSADLARRLEPIDFPAILSEPEAASPLLPVRVEGLHR